MTKEMNVDFSQFREPVSDYAKQLASATKDTTGKTGRDVMRTVSLKTGERYLVNPYDLRVKEGFNVRNFNDPETIQHVIDLAQQIVEGGIRNDLTGVVEGEHVYLTDGECRLRAVIYAIEELGADISGIPVKLEDMPAKNASEDKHREARQALIIRQLYHDKEKTPLEAGDGMVRLLQEGLTQADIARKLSITPARVSQILSFVDHADEELRNLVVSGAVSFAKASSTLKECENNPVKAVRWLTEAQEVAVSKGRTKVKTEDMPLANPGETGISENPEKKLSTKALVRQIFDGKAPENDDDEFVVFKIPGADYQRLMRSVGL